MDCSVRDIMTAEDCVCPSPVIMYYSTGNATAETAVSSIHPVSIAIVTDHTDFLSLQFCIMFVLSTICVKPKPWNMNFLYHDTLFLCQAQLCKLDVWTNMCVGSQENI